MTPTLGEIKKEIDKKKATDAVFKEFEKEAKRKLKESRFPDFPQEFKQQIKSKYKDHISLDELVEEWKKFKRERNERAATDE